MQFDLTGSFPWCFPDWVSPNSFHVDSTPAAAAGTVPAATTQVSRSHLVLPSLTNPTKSGSGRFPGLTLTSGHDRRGDFSLLHKPCVPLGHSQEGPGDAAENWGGESNSCAAKIVLRCSKRSNLGGKRKGNGNFCKNSSAPNTSRDTFAEC